MRAYKGSFIKKNGEEREMLFAKLSELPESFISTRILGIGKTKEYPEGMELVFDLEEDDFRIFNFNTIISELQEFNVEEDILTEFL